MKHRGGVPPFYIYAVQNDGSDSQQCNPESRLTATATSFDFEPGGLAGNCVVKIFAIGS